MKLNKSVKVALNVLEILKEGEPNVVISSKELAFYSTTTKAHLSQIMFKLKKAGIVGVKRGPNGGFFLNKSVLYLSDIIRAIGLKLDFEHTSSLDDPKMSATDKARSAIYQTLTLTRVI